MSLTENESLSLVSLAAMKTELRIPDAETSHDAMLTGQIHDAANFVQQATGLALADLGALAPAIVSTVRDAYNGNREIGPNAAANTFLSVYRSYKTG